MGFNKVYWSTTVGSTLDNDVHDSRYASANAMVPQSEHGLKYMSIHGLYIDVIV